jgi:hypothetical protein
MHARTQHIDRGSVSRYRCAAPLHATSSCSLLAPAQHTSPEQVCRALCFGMRGRGSAGGGHPSDPGGVTVSQQSLADRRRGIDAARGSNVLLPCVHCMFAFARVCKRPHVCVCACVCLPASVKAASMPATMHAARRPSSATSVDVTAPDTRRRRMLRQPAMRASAGAKPDLRVRNAPPSRPPARPAQASSTTSTCTIRPPGPGQTSPSLAVAPRPRPGLVTASRRRGPSSTCEGA